MAANARFDDLSQGREQAFEFAGLRDTIVAHRTEDVGDALARVDEARRAGLWAAGFVAYDAAPAFDAALEVRSGAGDDGFADLPLVWFATFADRIDVSPTVARPAGPSGYSVSGWVPDVDGHTWQQGVDVIRSRIAAGDTYQVNHSFRLRAAFSGEASELYRDLVLAQRGSYAAWLDCGRFKVASASPELFFSMADGRIQVRPMKGTMQRGRWVEEDRALAARLEASPKDRAENLMIVDLLRNDLGRIATFGSVRAPRLLTLERYETLWTLTSEVDAEVPTDVTLSDVLTALFPSGSVTGAPKASTMAIIADLEASPRGVYCGAIGFVAPGSGALEARFNVAIRTLVLDSEEGIAEYGVGGGITWDSEPSNEYHEARTKARLLVERRPEFELLETLRWDQRDGFVLLARHLDRVEASAEYFGFAFDREHGRELLEKSVSGLGGSVSVRFLINRDGTTNIEIDERVIQPFSDAPSGPVARVAVGVPEIIPSDVFLFHKTTRRAVYEEQRDAHPYAEDVLLVNVRGELTESTIANVVVRFGDMWWTPHVSSGLLQGVYRAELLARGEIGERVIMRDELIEADEIALVNSLRGWRAARIVGDSDD